MNDAELQAKQTLINAKIDKISSEVKSGVASLNTTITSLQDALAQAGNTSPATDALVNEALAKLDALDALFPDAPAPTPAAPAA